MFYRHGIALWLEKDSNRFASCEGISLADNIGKGILVSGNRKCKNLILRKVNISSTPFLKLTDFQWKKDFIVKIIWRNAELDKISLFF